MYTFSSKIKEQKYPSSTLLLSLFQQDLRFQPSSTTFPKCSFLLAKEMPLVGLCWLRVSIIPKAFEPIAQFIACEQEVRDIPKLWKKLNPEELSHWKDNLEQVSLARDCCMPASAAPLSDPVCADQAP